MLEMQLLKFKKNAVISKERPIYSSAVLTVKAVDDVGIMVTVKLDKYFFPLF